MIFNYELYCCCFCCLNICRLNFLVIISWKIKYINLSNLWMCVNLNDFISWKIHLKNVYFNKTNSLKKITTLFRKSLTKDYREARCITVINNVNLANSFHLCLETFPRWHGEWGGSPVWCMFSPCLIMRFGVNLWENLNKYLFIAQYSYQNAIFTIWKYHLISEHLMSTYCNFFF